MLLVGRIVVGGLGEALVPTPKRLSLLILGAVRELLGQVEEDVTEELMEGCPRQRDGITHRGAFGAHLERGDELLELRNLLGDLGGASVGRLQRLTARLLDETLDVLEHLGRLLGRVGEEVLELCPSPFDTVVDQVREVAQRAHGHAAALIGRTAVGIRASQVRHDDVHVRARPHRPRFEQWLLIEDALRVDVQARLHVVERIAHEIEAVPKVGVEEVLRRSGHQVLLGLDVEARVHRKRARRGRF